MNTQRYTLAVAILAAACLFAPHTHATDLPHGVRPLTKEELAEFREEQARQDRQQVLQVAYSVITITAPLVIALVGYLIHRSRRSTDAQE